MEQWQNLSYMLAGYAAAWLAFCGYLVWLAMRVRKLEREVHQPPGETPRGE